jgi:uncharacterized protein (DUF2249 family)
MTSTVVLASTAADSAAVEAITQHHAELVGTVIAHTTALLDASTRGDIQGASAARRDLVLFSRGDLLPHAVAEEDTLYAMARQLPGVRMLVDAMIAEHRVLADLIDDLADATTPLAASASAQALRVLFELHADKENEFILPALAQDPSVSLAEGLDGMHRTFEEIKAAAVGGGCGSGACGCGGHGGEQAGCGCGGHGGEQAGCACGGHGGEQAGCACGGHGGDEVAGGGHDHGAHEVAGAGPDAAGRPVLDARAVPHNIRHATVFGALDAVRPGSGLELIAPHDPLPLLAQIEQRNPGVFQVTYLERGPEAWRLAIDRRAAAV